MSRVSAVERVQRILSILPWIVSHPGCKVDEVAERFAIDRKSLLDDLDYVFYNVGIHPFTPDVLADVQIDEEDDRIHVTLGDYFNRPLRLSSSEALTLLTAAKAASRLGHLPGSQDGDPLLSAIEKLQDSLGLASLDALEVNIPDADRQLGETIRSAMGERRQLQINYYSFGRDHLGERTIEPLALANRRGHWYLRAWCHQADGVREFRLDRIYSAEKTDDAFVASSPGGEHSGDDIGRTRTVSITGPSSIEWVSRSYPVDSMDVLDDGRVRVVLPISTHFWLERLALRLPLDATISDVDSGEDLSWVRAETAKRVLDRYGAA